MKRLELRDWIGVAIIFAFVAALQLLFWVTIPTENEQLITYMLGQLSGFVAAIVGYHYVTSKSDEDKTANTGKAFDAIRAAAESGGAEAGEPDVTLQPGQTAQAAEPKP